MQLPKLVVPQFIRAIDKHEPLRAMLEARHPQAMRTASSFRKRIGDNCNYVRAALQVVWWEEWEKNSEQFSQHLRAAGCDVGPGSPGS